SLMGTSSIENEDSLVLKQETRKKAYTPHNPIVIVSDSNFSDTATQEGWFGDGSAGDPYIIEGFEINRAGVALDCIWISNTRVNFTIRNCNITGASFPRSGINLDNVTYGRIERNIVHNNHFNIYLANAHYVVVKNNTCWGSVYSISMRVSSSNNIITDNDSSNNSNRGVNIESSSQYNTVINNTCTGNVFGVVLYRVWENNIVNNTFNDNSDQGIHSNDADSNDLVNNTCNDNGIGIYLFADSRYNKIHNNTCNSNLIHGIYILSSYYNDVFNNTCNENGDYGIYFYQADYADLVNNTCNLNRRGIDLHYTDYSIISNNTCNFNDYGILLDYSTVNTISNNTCANNAHFGIGLFGSAINNVVEWNIYIDNNNGGYDIGTSNTVDYNYWSPYDGIDADQNGIGDTPYLLEGSSGNQDPHPLTILPGLQIGWVDSPSDQIFEYGVPVIYDVNASAFSGIDQWSINDTINFSIDSFGIITNSTILSIGVYGLDVDVNDTEGNFLSTTFTVNVVSVFPTWIELPTDQLVTYPKTFRYDLNATDYDGLDLWRINDTVNFAIDQDGIITNATNLAIGDYALQVSVNDTKGNTITAAFKVKVWIYTIHDPIVIVGDDEFSDIVAIEGWQGAGTSQFPYIIEYMIIDRDNDAGHCISITDTRVHFIIRGSILSEASVNPGSGVYLNNVTYGELTDNTCFSNSYGLYLYNSSGNSLVSNNCSSNSLSGIFLFQYGSQNIITDNTCHGNSVGIRIEDGGVDHDVLENSCNRNTAYGIYLLRASFSIVDNNTCNFNLNRGICLEYNSNNTIWNNLCNYNGAFGLVLYYSDYNDVFDNDFSHNGDQGIHHCLSDYNSIHDNICINNTDGLYVEESSYNEFRSNIFNNNSGDGINFYINYQSNEFIKNMIKFNARGLYLDYEVYNHVFLWNVIVENTISVEYDSFGTNLFDYNYWSDYNGVDDDGDGVGDTPYTIAGSIQDQHPLMMPPGSSPSWVDSPEPQYVELNFLFQYDLDVTVYSFIDHWWLNDTTLFNIDQDGIIANVTPLAIGTYGLEVSVNDTSGYVLSGSFNVIVIDTTPPYWIELPVTRVVELGSDFNYNLNATDLSGLDAWWLNDTIHFDIDPNGVVTNNIELPVGTFGIHVWVNDTFGSILDATFNVIIVDTTAPSWVIAPTVHQSEEGAPFTSSLDADDLSGLHTWWIN
ncbi:MAG: NosD domain-containing protein, partial [Candidatus Thorarchaeota archaeon]